MAQCFVVNFGRQIQFVKINNLQNVIIFQSVVIINACHLMVQEGADYLNNEIVYKLFLGQYLIDSY